jgi:alpha-D-ribose 1-methylphosphonate 5-triphosphate synthase subunit PhnI
LLDFSLTEEDESAIDDFLTTYLEIDPRTVAPPRFPRVLDILRAEGLLRPPPEADAIQEPLDITREALRFPAPRSAKLQALARGETGGLLALAYSSMRGHGYTHPVVGELRVGHVPLRVYTPGDDVTLFAGEVLITEAEVISATFTTDEGGDPPSFSAGYGLCFGHNEVKAIAMAVLDRSTSVAEPKAPAEDTEFVLLHTDGIESSGFAAHYTLPHYVTFQSYLDRLRTARAVKPEVTR